MTILGVAIEEAMSKGAMRSPSGSSGGVSRRAAGEVQKPAGMKRVVLRVPTPLHEDIGEFAAERGETVVGLFRWCLAVGRAIANEQASGNRFVVVSGEGEFKKELIFQR